ncbi:MAG: segregation/condensation protein A, partial [Bdellovibrionales bacterium]|nr:segregation/condensation protein A [Bdellovibrionales bacterium]
MSVHIQLEQFEGPMGLLLYLIRKDEMNIYDIQIHRITSQYLDYVKNMKELDLEGAGEFVQMASSLLLIKSRMLLPHTDEKGEELENIDPRKELVRRLVEYEKFREASKQLGKRPLLNRDVFGRGTRENFDALEDLVTVDDGGLFQMISLYRSLLKKVNSGVHQVTQKFQTIASRILELKGRLRMGERIELRDLLAESEKHRDKLLITFLSMLELARLQLVSLFQAESYGNLHIEPRAMFDESIVTHVQEYDAGAAGTPPPVVSAEAAPLVPTEGPVESESLEGLTEEDFLKAISDQNAESAVPTKMVVADPNTEMATDDEILQAERELG